MAPKKLLMVCQQDSTGLRGLVALHPSLPPAYNAMAPANWGKAVHTIKDTHWKLPYVVVGFDYTKRPLWQSVSLMVLAFYNASAVVIELLSIILLGSTRKACHGRYVIATLMNSTACGATMALP